MFRIVARSSRLDTTMHTNKTFFDTMKYFIYIIENNFSTQQGVMATHPEAEAGVAGRRDKLIERQSEIQVEGLPTGSEIHWRRTTPEQNENHTGREIHWRRTTPEQNENRPVRSTSTLIRVSSPTVTYTSSTRRI